MSDRLKQMVDANRETFDIYGVEPDELWPEIEKGIARRRQRAEFKWIWRVAAAFVIGVCLTMIFNYVNQDYSGGDRLAYQISPEWQETEEFYALQISEKMAAISSRAIRLDPVIEEDIQLLDQAYSELKSDLADDADNQEVIDAMIRNYQIKLQILERILVEIDETKAYTNEEDF